MSKTTSENPILFSYNRSSCSWRVRIVLNLKNIKYETRVVDISKPYTEEQVKEYSKINPMMQVPALVIDGYTLIETVAIMHYLEETRPDVPILPKDPIKRAKVREIVEIICASIQPMQNLGLLRKLDNNKRIEWSQYYITRGFNAIEKLLVASSGKYCVGDEITMADCCLVPQVYNALTRYNVDLSCFKNILRINQALESNEAFKQAHPTAQIDYTPEFNPF